RAASLLSFSLLLRPPASTLFPYTTLFRSIFRLRDRSPVDREDDVADDQPRRGGRAVGFDAHDDDRRPLGQAQPLAQSIGKLDGLDRKSTRLNSSHVSISYAVFCLKKKKNK